MCQSLLMYMYVCLSQAGDLYEKVNRNDEALQCYKKGFAYRRGIVVHIAILHIRILCKITQGFSYFILY